MSNKTPQQFLNNGYRLFEQLVISAPAISIIAITAKAGTNMIRVQQLANNRQVFIGNVDLIAGGSNGFPIFKTIPYFDGTDPATYWQPIVYEILTSAPENYYLTSDNDTNVIVQYFAVI